MSATIRPVRPEDGAALQEIERFSAERFRDVGLDAIADAEPESLEVLAKYARDKHAWLCVDELGQTIGYVLVDEVDGNAHVAQVSVLPSAQGKGAGRTLLNQVRALAEATGKASITLTTFMDVPWNRPLYEHLGFEVLKDSELGPEVSALRDAEAASGLDLSTRVCMRMRLQPEPRRGVSCQ